MGFFKRLSEKLSSDDTAHAQSVRNWVHSMPGVEQIAVCRPRTRVKVGGIVESITVVPKLETTILEVQVWDGTDAIIGRWYGRKKIPGVDLGMGMVLEGTISSSRGQLVIVNPAYQITHVEHA